MKWWDDIWLNEAFATYIAYLCTQENENLRTKTPSHWLSLNKRKSYAVNADCISTTHPIIKHTPNTDSADDNLDSITYGKGSGFLKQLMHIIGMDSMSRTCKHYFKKHAWGNTTLSDFIAALEYGCSSNPDIKGLDITAMCNAYLTTKGVNSLKIGL